MDIDDNDDQGQSFHIGGEGSFKVSSVSRSYPQPKFEFDDLVENEGFFDITSQTDNHWIEEYSTAVKSTRKNVWYEATSSESVEMLLKSVGQEKVLEESNRHGSLTNVMDPKGELESVVLGDETIDKIRDNVNEESGKTPTESFVNELQQDTSASKVENAGSENVEKASDNNPDNLTDSDVLNKDETVGNMETNVAGAVGSPKNVEGVIAMAQPESNMNAFTDAVVVVESSKISSPDTPDAGTSHVVTEGQPISPILGVSFQKPAPELEKDTVSDGAEKVVQLNASQSEQTGETNSGSLLDPKESVTVNMPDQQQQTSVGVADPSGCDTTHPSLDKPQICPLPDTKSIELSQSEKDAHAVTTGLLEENTTPGGTKEEKNVTLEVNTGASQNLNLSKNTGPSVSSPPSSTATEEGAKGNSESKPRKKSSGKETTKKGNNLKEKTPTRRSPKVGKPPPLLTTSATGNVTPVSNLKPGGMTPVSTPNLNNTISVFHQSFTDNQQVQLRAQILVYGSLLSGIPPEEPHMIAAFGQSDVERRAWEATWRSYIERVRGHKAQPSNLGPKAQPSKSAQTKNLSGISSPIVNPPTPVSSPLWSVPTPGDGSQSNVMPKSDLFDPYRSPGVHNFGGHNPMWPPQGPFPGQWVASSPVASFNARFSPLPITEAVKLTTVKESGAPTIPVIPVVSSGQSQSSSAPKSRKRKKVVSSLTASAALPTSLASTHGQPSRVDQNTEKVSIATQEEIVSKIGESKVQAADAAAHAAAAVNHYQNVWSQLESQRNSGLVSEDEAKLASLTASIAAASSIAKVAAAAAKIASDVAVQARLMADEVFLSNKTESHDQSGSTSIISAAKEAARRRIEAASAASKHAENLDAIVKAAELAAEAVSQAGKVVTIGNPLSLRELVQAGPEGFWKHLQSSSQQGHSDKQNDKMPLNVKLKEDCVDLTKNQITNARNENDRSTTSGFDDPTLSKTVVAVSQSELGSVNTSDVDQNMPQSTSGTWKDNTIKEGCLVEICKHDDKKKDSWFSANVLTLKDGKAFVCYTELESDDGSEKLKEWIPLEAEGTEPPRIRIAHPITTMLSEATRKRDRTALIDYDRSSESVHGDTPHQKRQKKMSDNANLVESGRHEESRDIPLSSSSKGSSFDLGKTIMNENKVDTHMTVKSGLGKKQSRVVFGVPKPGKKQKFMDMSTQSVDERNNKNNTPNDSVMPQPSLARGSKGSKEKQSVEVKPKVNKARKPPVPSFKTLTQKDKSKPSKPALHGATSSDEIVSAEPNKDFDSSNTEDTKETSTSKAVGKTASADSKETKVDVEEKSTSETEPRRSTRKIQPTSRLLEGLQSSLTISNVGQRSHKVASKGSTNSS